MVTSARSSTISDWNDSGDARIAAHGPFGSDAQVGTTGAAVSQGCVRLHRADLASLIGPGRVAGSVAVHGVTVTRSDSNERRLGRQAVCSAGSVSTMVMSAKRSMKPVMAISVSRRATEAPTHE